MNCFFLCGNVKKILSFAEPFTNTQKLTHEKKLSKTCVPAYLRTCVVAVATMAMCSPTVYAQNRAVPQKLTATATSSETTARSNGAALPVSPVPAGLAQKPGDPGPDPAGPVVLQPQMRKWNLIPNGVTFLTAQPSSFTNPNAVADGSLSAAAFDEDDKLLFYIKYGTQGDGTLHDANGVFRAALPRYRSNYVQDDNGFFVTYSSWGREMAVVPVPGACKQFYVFYTQTTPVRVAGGGSISVRSVLLRATIDCTGLTPIISSQPSPLHENLYSECGIAVSKKVNGVRWLYVRDRSSINAFAVSANGIGSAVYFNNLFGGPAVEMDLSPDGTRMAMSVSPTMFGGVLLADVDPGTGAVTNLRSAGPANGQAYGVEFSSDNKTLYISGTYSGAGAGIFAFTLATSQFSFLPASNLQGLNQTALELGFDGRIYGCTTSGGLVGLNQASNTLTAPITNIAISTAPSATTPLNGPKGYALPDQIDGEDYTFFFEGLEPKLSSVQTGGRPLNPNKFQNLYTCQASIPVTATLTNVTQVKLILDRANPDGTLVGSTAPLASSFITAGSAINLLTVFGNGYFVSNPGYYRLTYEGYNSCSNVRRVAGLIRVSNGAPVATFSFRTGDPNAAAVAGATVTTPANVGGLGGAVQLTNTSSSFEVYHAQIEQHNSANGTFTTVGSVFDGVFPAGSTTIRLNDIINWANGAPAGSSNYFAGMAQRDQVYKISLTLENACGPSPSAVGFFKPITDAYRPATGHHGTGQPAAAALTLHPNPATASDGQVRLSYELPTAQVVQIRLLNLTTGQHGPDALPQGQQSAGLHEVRIDLSGLPAGQYVAELLGEQQARIRLTKVD